MANLKNYIPIDTNGKNLEQCTDIPRKWNKILKLLQGDVAVKEKYIIYVDKNCILIIRMIKLKQYECLPLSSVHTTLHCTIGLSIRALPNKI